MKSSVSSTIDLHFHSRYSDAQHTPEELVYQLARINNHIPVKAACLSDHNTLKGQVPFQIALKNYNQTQSLEKRILALQRRPWVMVY